MKKLIFTSKHYDYSNKNEAKKDIPKMREKGYIVYKEYQAEQTYVIEYGKDLLGRRQPAGRD